MIFKIIILLKFIEFYSNAQDIVDSKSYEFRMQGERISPNVQKLEPFNSKCITSFGQLGRCLPIKNCFLTEVQQNYLKIFDYMCLYNKTSFGICCPGGSENFDVNKNNQVYDHFYSTRDAKNDLIENRGCGMSTRKFSGGDNVESNTREWPWMAAIFRTGFPNVYCGGTLITDRDVLSAAHCFHLRKKNEFIVRLGEYDIQKIDETRSRDFTIMDIRLHVDFDPITLDNDIGIIRLDRPTLFNSYIWPICMPQAEQKYDETHAVVTGWGTQFYGGPFAKTLLEVSIPIWNNERCEKSFIDRILDTVICAGEYEGGKDTCQGDSGGPLLIQLPNQRWVVIGIVSWGLKCGQSNYPGVYTRVDKYLPWISENISI